MFWHLAYWLLALSTDVLAANLCGTIGIHNDTKIYYYMGNFFYKGPTSFALCALYCKKDTGRCKSFRYSYYSDAAAQYCEFFDNGLDGNITADSTQPYYYYDVGCPFPAYADVSTTTVSSQGRATTITQVPYQTQTITMTAVQPATTQTVTTTSVPPAATKTTTTTFVVSATAPTQTVYITTTPRPSATTQTTTRVINQTTTTTFAQPTRFTTLTIIRTITQPRTTTIATTTITQTRTQAVVSTQSFTIARATLTSTSVSVRSTTIVRLSTRTATMMATVTVQVIAAADARATVTVTKRAGLTQSLLELIGVGGNN